MGVIETDNAGFAIVMAASNACFADNIACFADNIDVDKPP
jgi:hypothetical protein